MCVCICLLVNIIKRKENKKRKNNKIEIYKCIVMMKNKKRIFKRIKRKVIFFLFLFVFFYFLTSCIPILNEKKNKSNNKQSNKSMNKEKK